MSRGLVYGVLEVVALTISVVAIVVIRLAGRRQGKRWKDGRS